MRFDAALPVIGLMLTIYVVTKLRESLLSQAMFERALTRSFIGERIAHGAQLALCTLLAIVAVAAFWSHRPDSQPLEVNPSEQRFESHHEQYVDSSEHWLLRRWLTDP